MKQKKITLRSMERSDLEFIHALDNNATIMRYWFEEPFVSIDELREIYDKHIHDQHERRFIITNEQKESIGLVELLSINQIHRYCEFLIIISPTYQGFGYAKQATSLAIDYAFNVLNLHKVILFVDKENIKAIHIYETLGFLHEGELKEHFYANGKYRDVIVMGLLRRNYENQTNKNQP